MGKDAFSGLEVVNDQRFEPNDKLRAKVNEKVAARERMYGIPCGCSCGCRVRFRFGEVCALCRHDDHWTRIVELLDKIMRSD